VIGTQVFVHSPRSCAEVVLFVLAEYICCRLELHGVQSCTWCVVIRRKWLSIGNNVYARATFTSGEEDIAMSRKSGEADVAENTAARVSRRRTQRSGGEA
jgi:hypothetical protein